MPITREPSRRALNWVGWNSNKGSSNSSNNDSKRAAAAEPEIVHLGGVHVGTATDLLGLPPAPGRSTPTDRPPAQWAFNPLASNPTRPNMAANGSLGVPMGEDDRPLTQWFPTWQEDMAEDNNESQKGPAPTGTHLTPGSHLTPNANTRPNTTLMMPSANNNMASNNSGLMPSVTLTPSNTNPNTTATPSTTDSIEEKSRYRAAATPRSPPQHIVTQINQLTQSPPEIAASASSPPPATSQSPTTTAELIPETQLRPAKFPQRSTSLSQASRHAPPRLAKRPIRAPPPPSATELNLRRTQSHAEVQRSAGWRGQQPQASRMEGEQAFSTRAVHEALRSPMMMSRTSPDLRPTLQRAHTAGPVTPVSREVGGVGREQQQPMARGPFVIQGGEESASPEEEVRAMRPKQASQPKMKEKKERNRRQKLTAKERYWLHKHYRGEAGFLKAWGLDIASEEDRVEGVEILRDLMEAEAREGGAGGGGEKMSRSRSMSDYSSDEGTESSAVGLGVIQEERHSRDFHATNHGYHGERQHGMMGDPKADNHSRNGSNESVLGEYLDLRLDVDRF